MARRATPRNPATSTASPTGKPRMGLLRFSPAGRLQRVDEGFVALALGGGRPAPGANVLRAAPFRALALGSLVRQAKKTRSPAAGQALPPAVPFPLSLWLLPIVGGRGAISDYLLLVQEQGSQGAQPHERDFLANLSHELRTPLNAVMGFLRLAEGIHGKDEERQHDYLRSAQQAAAGMLELFNNFLDLAKMDAGRLTLESIEFDPLQLAEEAARILAPLAHGKRVEIAASADAGLPPVLRGDPGRIRQVLVNLVSNAVKFTEQGAVTILVSGEPGPEGSFLARFAVRDTGMGIPQEQQARIFESFVQHGGALARGKAGTGLGLTICRQLAREMGGDIAVDSKPGQGSTFLFSAVLRVSPGAPPARPPLLGGARLLAVDPNEITRAALARNLAALGAEVDEAGSARDAESLLERAADQERPVRAVIVDAQIRQEAALGLAHTVRIGRGAYLPDLVYMSSTALLADAAILRGGGYSTILTKPVFLSALGSTLAGLLKSQTSQGSTYKPTRRAPERSLANRAARREVHILVAEDNAINQKLVQTVLVNQGYSATIVPNGKAALEALEREDFDLILMDVQMPELDGLSATREIRRRFGSRVPVVAMTADTLEGDRERCLAAGMNDYLTKPLMPGHLDHVIEQWVGRTANGPQTERFGRWLVLDQAHLDAVRDYAAAHKVDTFSALCRLFETELTAALQQINSACTSENWTALLAWARQAAQLAEGFGAPRLNAMARELEAHCRDHNRPLARDLASQLHLEGRSVGAQLQRAYGGARPGAGS